MHAFSKALRYGNTQSYLQTSHTCLYSPATEHHHPLAGTHFTVPWGVEGWVELDGWLCTEINFRPRELNPDMVTCPSTNRASRRLTSLIKTNYAISPPWISPHKMGWTNSIGSGDPWTNCLKLNYCDTKYQCFVGLCFYSKVLRTSNYALQYTFWYILYCSILYCTVNFGFTYVYWWLYWIVVDCEALGKDVFKNLQ